MTRAAAIGLLATLVVFSGSGAQAGLFHHAAKPLPSVVTDASIAAIQKAVDEQRLTDAGDLLDRAFLAGGKDTRLFLLAGELLVERERFSDALDELKKAETSSETRGKALEYEGIALSMLGRSDEALATLNQAVAQEPSEWRAWNALGGEFDERKSWTEAEAAYDHALADLDNAAIVLNNRGFSRLLQGRYDAANDDFVAALQKKPDLTTARTNLRLALALKGEYDRATEAGAQDDKAAILNNAGFAAMMRGDYPKAEDLFTQAIAARGEYYARAAQNLALAKSLATTQKAPPVGAQ